MNFILAFILLIGTTTQIAQSEEISTSTTETQYVSTNYFPSLDIESRLSSMWNSLSDTTNQGYAWFSSAFSNMNKNIQQDASDATNAMGNAANDVNNKISNAASYTGDSLKSAANTVDNKMSNAEYNTRETIREGSES